MRTRKVVDNGINSLITRYVSCAKYYISVSAFAGILSVVPLSAEPSTAIRILSGYYLPVDDPVFQPGFGAAAAFDLMTSPFTGFFAQGEYVNITLDNVPSFALTDGSIGAGLQWRMSDRFSFRGDLMAGIYSVSRNESSLSGLSAGARVTGSYHNSPALSTIMHTTYRHYAYSPEPFMTSLSLGVGVSLNLKEAFNPEKHISAETEKQNPVFPVLYSWYDNNHFSEIRITNNEENTITDIQTSFYLEQYMGQPKLCKKVDVLKPGESYSVPVTAFFNEAMLELSETINTKARVIVEYKRLGSKRKAEIEVSMPVFHRNAMSWEDDRRAAAFVSSKDPAALWFSKYVSSIVGNRFRDGINKNTQYAIGVFEALNIYGLNYVIDPTSSYADIADDSATIDFLQYPYQTLMYRGGDCDDLSILYSSLLEAIGIDTAFITIPGHIFMAYSSGMTEEEAKSTFHAPDQLIYHDGMAWVPLEITLMKEGYNKAWRVGAKEWNDADARGTANIYPMKDSWKIYKPVSIPGAASRFNLPDEERTIIAFDHSLDTYTEREIRPQIMYYQELLAKSDSAEIHNRLGVLYGRYGMLEPAKSEFQIASRKRDPHAWVNYGNILFLEEKYPEALTYYEYALSIDKNNSIAILGVARCYYELDEYAKSDTHYSTLASYDPYLASGYGYLGSFFETRGRAWSLADRLSTTAWSLPEKTMIKTDENNFTGKYNEKLAKAVNQTAVPSNMPDKADPLDNQDPISTLSADLFLRREDIETDEEKDGRASAADDAKDPFMPESAENIDNEEKPEETAIIEAVIPETVSIAEERETEKDEAVKDIPEEPEQAEEVKETVIQQEEETPDSKNSLTLPASIAAGIAAIFTAFLMFLRKKTAAIKSSGKDTAKHGKEGKENENQL